MTDQPDFQARVEPWLLECFGTMIAGDKEERNHRFLEEALELVQACGCSASEAHQLVDYVFARDLGEKSQEAGGVMVTLAALCLAQGLDMRQAAEAELARIWTKVEQIRAKQAAKPKHSPLPQHSASKPAGGVEKKRWRHLKRGTTYVEIGRGRLQIEGPADMAEVVIYRADEDGSVWVRPAVEFEDGRFAQI